MLSNVTSPASVSSVSDDRVIGSSQRCPYIVGYHGAYIDMEYGTVNLILEYMNAGSVQQRIDEGVIFSVDDAAVLAYSVLTALQTLHENGIVHRDIKPSNLLINSEGIVKLHNFRNSTGKTLHFIHYTV
jgi:mitogen-activated protein kinase kinase